MSQGMERSLGPGGVREWARVYHRDSVAQRRLPQRILREFLMHRALAVQGRAPQPEPLHLERRRRTARPAAKVARQPALLLRAKPVEPSHGYVRPDPPPLWVGGDNLPWNDPVLSERMLREHLEESHGAATRQTAKRAIR